MLLLRDCHAPPVQFEGTKNLSTHVFTIHAKVQMYANIPAVLEEFHMVPHSEGCSAFAHRGMFKTKSQGTHPML